MAQFTPETGASFNKFEYAVDAQWAAEHYVDSHKLCATGFRGAYSGPRVYRWAVFENDLLTAAYVGEAENLCRRLGG
jgi:hypothetical protein